MTDKKMEKIPEAEVKVPEKEIVEEVPENQKVWNPVTELGREVKAGKILDIDEIFNSGKNILEAEIVDQLLPNLEEDLLMIGQAKGKFGGGQRRIFKQTQKKTSEGNRMKFTTCCVVGNRNGYVGIGIGKSKETVPSRDKARRKARLNIIRVRRGCGSWETDARYPNSIPFAVEGKCGSIRIKLFPAPPGKGLVVEKECAKILDLAGIRDVRSKMSGKTDTKLNVIFALVDALQKLSRIKIRPEDIQKLGIVEGKLQEERRDLERAVENKEKSGVSS